MGVKDKENRIRTAMGRIADKEFYNSAPKRLIYDGGESIRVVK